MKNTRNEVKIQFEEPKYHIDEYNKVVVCRLTAKAMIPHNFKQIMWDVDDVWPLDLEEFETKGIARLSPNDDWDENTGMKVALAKAENKAYEQVCVNLKEYMRSINTVIEQCKDFFYKSANVIEHNNKYLEKF